MELVSPIPRRGPRVPNARIGLLMTGLIVAAIALLGVRSIEWFILNQSLRHRFPKVQWITTVQLADWFADKNRPPPVLLDIRTDEEWNVSRLPGAQRVDPNASLEVISGMPKDAPIVTYCAVGYRSGALATKLRGAGFSNVWNLEGSIFQWANEHRPLVRDDGKPVTTVHPYSNLWGRLLSDDVRAPLEK